MRYPNFLAALAIVGLSMTAACASQPSGSQPSVSVSPSAITQSAGSSTSSPLAPSTSVTESTAGPACSAAGLTATTATQTGLPTAVAQMRSDLAAAAVNCDYVRLATTLADRDGIGVRYSFGPQGDAAGFWRTAEAADSSPAPMLALRKLLDLSYGTVRLDNGTVLYEWPAAFASGHPTDAQLTEIANAGLYPMTTLREWVATGNNYLGYRVVIAANGDWMAFVAGD